MLALIDHAQDAFKGIDRAAFDDIPNMRHLMFGLLVQIGQDANPAAGHTSERLGTIFRDLRNALCQEYAFVENADLWRAFELLPELRADVERHRAPPVRDQSTPRTVGSSSSVTP